ncbi:hypothetical protein WN944_019438 [Citrus x changshan-huyou]|uniref:Uncharacterized protein n=1 Tax=Citrus x changshan-huyou TaxID=2935761 RepID=A0AAP0M1N1_9ROSI
MGMPMTDVTVEKHISVHSRQRLVGGSSKADVRKKKKIVTNALNAAKAAMEEGILPGGSGISLLHASKELDKLEITNSSQKIGVQIIQNALKMPVHAIPSSAGVAGSFVGKLLAQENHDLACDATTEGEYVDMIDSGIVEPLKVISTAFLEAARSCASVTELEGSSSSGRKSITRKPLPPLFLLSHCRCSVSAVTAAAPTLSSYCCSVFALPDLSLAHPLYGGGNRTTDFRAAAADVIQVRAAATFFKFELLLLSSSSSTETVLRGVGDARKTAN